MNSQTTSRPLALRKIQITDEFWKDKMELVRNEVIPYQWEALNDRIKDAAPSFCMRNFELAGRITRQRLEYLQRNEHPQKYNDAQGYDNAQEYEDVHNYKEKIFPTNQFETLPEDMNSLEDRFYGFLFQDSDFYKWIEAVAYSLTQHPDYKLEQIADEAIEIVCAAQQPNGYLNTFYTINDPAGAFTNLRSNHELYCFGHLTEGAIAYYEATGKRILLHAAEKYADYISSQFGPEDDKLHGYPGHEIAEMALARLYEVTGNYKYLSLGKFFIDERGRKPYYFDFESKEKIKDPEKLRYEYYQAHLPVREQEEAVGHAVRAVYLYSGMADFARLTNDESLLDSCRILWNDITQKKMYITGGIGSTHMGEAFTYAYDLPNDTAYAETCASIGLVFFARRMLEIDVDSRYADVMERALYNGILSGMAEDGKSFFYTNPLSVFPKACHKDERLRHIRPVRQKWFGCACCPPNIARLISSLSSYAFTETTDTLFVHLYIGAKIEKEIDGNSVQIDIDSAFPWNGDVAIKIRTSNPQRFTLALRIPDWCNNYNIQMDNNETEVQKGYLYITKTWTGEENISLTFPMEIKRIKSNPFVRENIGKTALMRGPIVYCLEEADNGNNLHLVSLSSDATLYAEQTASAKSGTNLGKTSGNTSGIVSGMNLGMNFGMTSGTFSKMVSRTALGMTKIRAIGSRVQLPNEDAGLYSDSDLKCEPAELTWVPYYSWANRGEGEMQVWITCN